MMRENLSSGKSARVSKKRNDHLKRAREQRGWSQARVAEQVGTDAATVSRWERGYATPSPYFREKLCALFEQNAQDLGFLWNEQAASEQESLTLAPSVLSPPSQETSSIDRENDQTRDDPSRHARRLASLSYLLGWASGLCILLVIRENRFIRFHSLQSTLFFAGSQFILLTILVLMALTAPPAHTAVSNFPLDMLETGLALLFLVVGLLTLLIWVVGMVQAWQGKSFQVPFVGPLSKSIIAKRSEGR